MSGVALGDVGHRQPGDQPALAGQAEDFVKGAEGREDVRVAELDPLRRAGRAGGVDHRRHLLRPNRPPGRLEVEAGIAARLQFGEGDRAVAGIAVDHDHVLEGRGGLARSEDGVEESRLGDQHSVGGVGDQVLDLLRGRGVVEGEGRRSEVHRRGIDEVELGPVGEHDPDRVAAPDPKPGQSRGHRLHPLRVLGPGGAELVVLGPERGLRGMLGGRHLEGLGERRRFKRPRSRQIGLFPFAQHSQSPQATIAQGSR